MIASLSGYIVDKTNLKPIPNVKVVFDNIPVSTFSKANGFYKLKIPTGKYKVTYSIKGYEVFQTEVTFSSPLAVLGNKADVKLDVELTPQGSSAATATTGVSSPNKGKRNNISDDTAVRPKIPRGMEPLELSPGKNFTNDIGLSENLNNLAANLQSAENVGIIPRPNVLSTEFIKEKGIRILKKPILITRNELIAIDKDIKLVSYNPLQDLVADADKPFSIRLLNWVEPYEILGTDYTLFYTEVNTNLKVGDRIFIIGGNYDSDALIQIDKYKRGRDGYKVLYVDFCQIVLDIRYNGTLPYIEEDIDSFVKVYYIRNEQEFLQASRQISTGNGTFDYKFGYYQNNIAFIDNDYITGKSWGRSGGVFAQSSPGFFIKNGPTQSWTDITTDFMVNGTYSYALSPTYSINDRIKIMNGDFTYNGKTYKEGYVYKWYVGPTQSEWIVDVKYFKPIMTKGNWRGGNFNGIWNTGLFGSYNKRINWEGTKSTWNAGTLLNTKWEMGKFDSIFTLPVSYIASFDEYSLPYQKVNIPNNNGKSFNYIIDSTIETSTIVNGSILESVIGNNSSATFSVVENHILNLTFTYPNTIKKAYFENCEFNNSYISNSEIKNIRSYNSKFENVKCVNSHFRHSVFYNSNFNSDNIIKILGYDEINANEFPDITSTFSVAGSFEAINLSATPKDAYQKVYKFYIDKNGYNRLKNGDEFYLRGIKLNNNSKEIINLFDKKFRLSTWTEYIDDLNSSTVEFYKRPIDVGAFLSTPLENAYLFESVRNSTVGSPDRYYTSVYEKNAKELYSIDIWISLHDLNEQNSGFTTQYFPELKDYLNINTLVESPTKYDYISATGSGPTKIGDIVDISTAYIVDSDFDSGLFENSNWNNGSFINSQNDQNITVSNSEGGVYNLSFTQSNSIIAITTINPLALEKEYVFEPGQVVFLDNVEFFDGTTITKLPDAYKITSNSAGILILEEIVTGTTSQIISLSQSVGTFSTFGANNRYGYIKSLKFNKSKIKSGLFRRPYIKNSLIETEIYDPLDRDYSNISKARNLVITDIISYNNSNYLSSATYLYSSFLSGNDVWNKGIIEYSIWNSGTFSAGTIKQSTWMDGLFTNGYFFNSRSFNNNATVDYQTYDTDRIRTYWKSGITSNTPALSNNRFSWRNGIFLDGEFYKSDWENGTFSNGRFWSSKWYGGVFENGVIGSNQVATSDTEFYNGLIKYATVENATIIAEDTSYNGLSASNVLWIDGVFNDGIFSVETDNPVQNWATWSTGVFNYGEFTSMAKWKDGTFNNGKFTSFYGWTQSNSLTQSDYGWEKGIFNGGEFGNANGLTNSIWFTGEFNNGTFRGRTWNSGIFLFGNFEGSGQNPVSGLTCSNASDFVDSYSYSFWGEWRSGYFTDTKDKLVKDKKVFTEIKQATEPQARLRLSKISNALWKSGTFSHPTGVMESSVWLDGVFEQGKFVKSSFNPYVKRNGSLTASFNLNDTTCYWENGLLYDSDFHISIWERGIFDLGTATGMIWQSGVANYMNAYNVFWEDGFWRNGNWNGSTWEFNTEVTEDYVKQILYRGMSWSGTSSCHVWNLFLDNSYNPNTIVGLAATISTSVFVPSVGNTFISVGTIVAGGGDPTIYDENQEF